MDEIETMAEEENNNQMVEITWEDGMWSRRERYAKDAPIHLPDDYPSESSGDFLGWYTLQDGGIQIQDGLLATRNNTFFAHWRKRTHTVTGYDQSITHVVVARDENGNVLYSAVVPHGATIESIPNPVSPGYQFLGWFYADGTAFKYSTKIVSDIEIVAHWNLITYKIAWNAGGHGEIPYGVPDSYTVFDRGRPITRRMANLPEWEFDGWNPPSIPSTAIGPIEFMGKWKTRWYDIRLNANGGVLPEGTQSDFQRTYQQSVFDDGVPIPTREGYDFICWECGSEQVAEDTLVQSDMNIVAQWRIKTFVVTKYPVSDQSDSESRDICWGVIPSDFLQPKERDADKYTFLGWNTASDGSGEVVDGDTLVKSDLTIYGLWRGNVSHNLTYDANGGGFDRVTMTYDANPESREAVIGADRFPTPNRTGYVFGGWTESPDSDEVIEDETYTIDKNTTIYAKWQEDVVKVVLHSNGGILRSSDRQDEAENMQNSGGNGDE